MHSAADVAAGFVAYTMLVRRCAIWESIRRASEYLANSWREVQIGPIRLASHGIYTGIGASIGVAVAVWLAGAEQALWIAGLTLAAIVGAALWAQLIEGSPQLLRPYGYFGSAFTVMLVALAAGAAGADAWLLTAAMATGSSFAHAVGRLRCLVHGCCHGREAPVELGIRYTQPMTRVVRLSALSGVPIYPVQIYSLVSMLFVGAVLMRLWMLGTPVQFIAGAYLILVGLFRFAEEHFRGEPQTAVVGGLRLYQWLAIGFVVLGAVLTCFAGSAAPAPSGFTASFIPVILGIGMISFFAYGGDFPLSERRFARLR
jgi:prolipoprotein diacylglyceryltransferase